MKESGRIMETSKMKNPPVMDNPGECFSKDDHYYRQDKNQVLHVASGIVNTLPMNHLEESRVNWGDTFERVEPVIFQAQLEKQLQKFFE